MNTESIEYMIQKIREFEARHGGKRVDDEPDEEDLAEEVQHHTSLIFTCNLPGVIHSNLIPWYTSGFQ